LLKKSVIPIARSRDGTQLFEPRAVGGYKTHAMGRRGVIIVRVCVAVAMTIASQLSAQETGLPVIPPDEPPAQPGAITTQPTVQVTGFRFQGNTVFNDAQFLKAPVAAGQTVGDYVGKPVTTETLEDIRQALTRLYVSAGYINSGAVLPDQTVDDGIVNYQIVEGRLSDVKVAYVDPKDPSVLHDRGRLRQQYVISRVRLGGKTPLNIIRLKNELEILRQNPNLTRVNAELRPGTAPGEANLDVQVGESNPFQLGLQISNRRSPSVGAEQVEILASDRNLTGNGDVLALRYGVNTGGFDAWHWAGLDDYSIDYTIPITPADTTLGFSYTRTDSLVVEAPFDDLDITSISDTVAVTIRHPFYRSTNAEFAMFLSQGWRQNRTKLLGNSFSFSPGAENGETEVAPIRFGQELTTRSQVDALALRSTFSFGTSYLGATKHADPDLPDGQYFAWLGQAQYVRRVQPSLTKFFEPADPSRPLADWQLVLRGSAQVATDSLFPIEQFAVGGIDTVRGYRENQIVRDNGVAGSVELQIPVITTVSGNHILKVVPFVDLGYGDNVNSPHNAEFLPSVGVGLQYTPNDRVTAQLYYGYALRNVNRETDNLQDVGIHFNVLVLAF
jgi:hemolysin activation/secretion protein